MMLLNTPLYLLFLAAVFLLFWFLPRPAWRKAFLLLASYGMYATFDLRFPLVLLGITAATFLIARALPGSRHPRGLACLGIAIGLGALAYCKYTGFFLSNVSALLGHPSASPVLQVLLPIGISFYSFQAVAYLVDVGRRKMTPVANLVDFGLYLAFFPKLLAGPFVRPAEFLGQLADLPHAPAQSGLRSSMQLILSGLFRKVVIADSLAALADISFRAAGSPHAAGFPMPLYLAGFYLYAVQIYADFSGYTNIARGSAGLLGIVLPENFNRPYFALSPGDFWNRWHMSLTQWFREYVFFPLSRWGMIRTDRRFPRLIQSGATLITMILVGFWHGAAWTYLLWGAWHGLLLILDRLFSYVPHRGWEKVLAGIVTFHLVGIGWVIFRSPSPAVAGRFLAGMFSFNQTAWFPQFLPPALLALGLIVVLDAAGRMSGRFSGWIRAFQPAANIAVITIVIVLWLLQAVSQTGTPPFIYSTF